MTKFKSITAIVVSLLLILTAVCGMVFTYTQNYDGRYTGIYNLSESDKEWVVEQFGDCTDIECLLNCVEEYALENFEYDTPKKQMFQHFDFRDTVSTNKGICFDFSCFLKSCCLVWSEHTNTELKVYVVDVCKRKNILAPHHSYNVVMMPDGKNYYIDLTNDLALNKKGKDIIGIEVFYTSIKTYAAKYGETVLNYH